MSKCAFDSCPNPCFVDPNTRAASPYCSRNHMQMDQQRQAQQRSNFQSNMMNVSGGMQPFHIFTLINNMKGKQNNTFPTAQRIYPHDVILFETNNGMSSQIMDELNLKLKILIDFVQIECHSPNDVLAIVKSNNARRVLCCIATSTFTVSSCPFPIFNINELGLVLTVANLFRRKTSLIYFYNNDEPYYQFTNFFELPGSLLYEICGEMYPTTEHYFQSKKFVDPSLKVQVLKTKTPREAFSTARGLNSYKIPNWEQAKDQFMREALVAKFSVEDLQLLLYFSGNAKIFEHTENDNYWADGGFEINGQGKNMLGTMLMELRNKMEIIEPTPQRFEEMLQRSPFYYVCLSKLKGQPIPQQIQTFQMQQLNRMNQFHTNLTSSNRNQPHNGSYGYNY